MEQEITSIALFGTSADPPTVGHQTILNWLSQHYDLVVVWASDNPFKNHQTSLKSRSEMLGLVIEEIQPAKANIMLCPEISDRRTLITLQKAKAKWQQGIFTLVIGADLVKQIVTWYQIEALFKQVKILIIPRRDYVIETEALNKLQALGGEYSIATLNAPRVSSSLYRLRQDTKVITSQVSEYIKSHNLYI